MKRFIAILLAAVMLVPMLGEAPTAYAAGSAYVSYSGEVAVSPGQTYTYSYTLHVNSAFAANANIAVDGAFQLVSGGQNLFYDAGGQTNTSGTVSGTITVYVRPDAPMGSTARIYVTPDSRCSEIVFNGDGTVTQDPIETQVTGWVTAYVTPGTPSLAWVGSTGYTSAAVAWNPVAGVSGYEVWRSTSANGSYTRLAFTDSSVTSYSDFGLTTNRTYYYKVRAHYWLPSGHIFGQMSAPGAATPVPAAAAVWASSYSYSKAKVSWSAVPGASGYQLFRATSINGSYKLVRTQTKTSYINSGLATGTPYYYRVRAYRTVGKTKVYGEYSAPAGVIASLNGVARASAKRRSSNSIKVSWSSVSGRSGYELWRSTSPSGGFQLVKSLSGSSYTDTKLGAGTTYYYKVRAYRTVGRSRVYGAYSPVTSARP